MEIAASVGLSTLSDNAYSLNPRLIDQAGDVGFFHGHCMIDFSFATDGSSGPPAVSKTRRVRTPSIVGGTRGTVLPETCISRAPSPGIVGTRAHRYGLDGRVLKQLSGPPLLDRRNALAFLRDQCRLRSPYLRGTGRGGMRAAHRVVWATHNGKRRIGAKCSYHVLNRVGDGISGAAAIEKRYRSGCGSIHNQRT